VSNEMHTNVQVQQHFLLQMAWNKDMLHQIRFSTLL